VIGLRLEIVPLENPYSKKVGDVLRFRVRFNRKPLVGKTIFAENRNTTQQKMITDRDGRIAMRIDRSGVWLVHLVFMRRCTTDCIEADWESFWGTFSFGVR
jgi:hypothetical protein